MRRLILATTVLALTLGLGQLTASRAEAASLLAPGITASVNEMAKQASDDIIRIRHKRHRGRVAAGIAAAIIGAAILAGAARAGHPACYKERVCRPVEHCRWKYGYEKCHVHNRCRWVTYCD